MRVFSCVPIKLIPCWKIVTDAGVFTPNDDLAREIFAASDITGEKFWRMPLEESYWESMKSGVADMVNTGGRQGGSITAALFLKQVRTYSLFLIGILREKEVTIWNRSKRSEITLWEPYTKCLLRKNKTRKNYIKELTKELALSTPCFADKFLKSLAEWFTCKKSTLSKTDKVVEGRLVPKDLN